MACISALFNPPYHTLFKREYTQIFKKARIFKGPQSVYTPKKHTQKAQTKINTTSHSISKLTSIVSFINEKMHAATNILLNVNSFCFSPSPEPHGILCFTLQHSKHDTSANAIIKGCHY